MYMHAHAHTQLPDAWHARGVLKELPWVDRVSVAAGVLR